jgi:hypothetical protein
MLNTSKSHTFLVVPSPSCATLERHLNGKAAAAAKNGGGGELGFRRLGWGCSRAAGVWIGGPRVAARLIKAGSPPWRVGHARERVPGADSGGDAVGLDRVRPGHDPRKGMTGGPHLSSAAGAGERGSGLAAAVGPERLS